MDDEIVVRAEAKMTICVPTEGICEVDFEALLWKEPPKCGSEPHLWFFVHTESVFSLDQLKGIFIEILNTSVRQNVRMYWTSNHDTDLAMLCRYAVIVAKFGQKEPQNVTPTVGRTKRCRGI